MHDAPSDKDSPIEEDSLFEEDPPIEGNATSQEDSLGRAENPVSNEDDKDFHPSKPRYDTDGNFITENDEQTQREAKIYAKEQAEERMLAGGKHLSPEMRT